MRKVSIAYKLKSAHLKQQEREINWRLQQMLFLTFQCRIASTRTVKYLQFQHQLPVWTYNASLELFENEIRSVRLREVFDMIT